MRYKMMKTCKHPHVKFLQVPRCSQQQSAVHAVQCMPQSQDIYYFKANSMQNPNKVREHTSKDNNTSLPVANRLAKAAAHHNTLLSSPDPSCYTGVTLENHKQGELNRSKCKGEQIPPRPLLIDGVILVAKERTCPSVTPSFRMPGTGGPGLEQNNDNARITYKLERDQSTSFTSKAPHTRRSEVQQSGDSLVGERRDVGPEERHSHKKQNDVGRDGHQVV
jgi:hypothetical protein